MKKLLIILLLAGCAKPEKDCYDINGEFALVELWENGNLVCEYGPELYYLYDFDGGIVYVTQYRNGADSFVRSFVADCNSVFGRTEYTFNYGSPVAYGVLKK